MLPEHTLGVWLHDEALGSGPTGQARTQTLSGPQNLSWKDMFKLLCMVMWIKNGFNQDLDWKCQYLVLLFFFLSQVLLTCYKSRGKMPPRWAEKEEGLRFELGIKISPGIQSPTKMITHAAGPTHTWPLSACNSQHRAQSSALLQLLVCFKMELIYFSSWALRPFRAGRVS